MKKDKIIFACTVLIFVSKLFATSTLFCSCQKEGCGILLHVNTDDIVVDLTIFLNEKDSYIYDCGDFDEQEISWKNYEEPFDENYLLIICKGKSTSKPKFKILVKGKKGNLTFNNREYEIECDWNR